MPPPSQQSELDRAYQRGYEAGLNMRTMATERVIKINLAGFSAALAGLGLPSCITFDVKSSATVDDVVKGVLKRLPEIPYPFDIMTTGSRSKILEGRDTDNVTSILPYYDSTVLSLRLYVEIPEQPKERKKSIGAKLRTALGRSSSTGVTSEVNPDAIASNTSNPLRETQQSELPTYEEATRPLA